MNYLPDSAGTEYHFMNIVDRGVGFQIEMPIREGAGMPTSKECYDVLRINGFHIMDILEFDEATEDYTIVE